MIDTTHGIHDEVKRNLGRNMNSDENTPFIRRRGVIWSVIFGVGAIVVASVLVMLRPPASAPIGGVEFSPVSALAPSELSVDEAESAVRDAIADRLETVDLDPDHRNMLLEQAPVLLVAHTHGLYDRYFGTVASWGARPRPHMTQVHLDKIRADWASRVWEYVDLKHAKVWIAERNDAGVLVLTTPTSRAASGAVKGVAVESTFEYQVDVKELARSGAPVLGIALPARVTSAYGESQLIEARFFVVWSESDRRWLPFMSACASETPPPALPL